MRYSPNKPTDTRDEFNSKKETEIAARKVENNTTCNESTCKDIDSNKSNTLRWQSEVQQTEVQSNSSIISGTFERSLHDQSVPLQNHGVMFENSIGNCTPDQQLFVRSLSRNSENSTEKTLKSILLSPITETVEKYKESKQPETEPLVVTTPIFEESIHEDSMPTFDHGVNFENSLSNSGFDSGLKVTSLRQRSSSACSVDKNTSQTLRNTTNSDISDLKKTPLYEKCMPAVHDSDTASSSLPNFSSSK